MHLPSFKNEGHTGKKEEMEALSISFWPDEKHNFSFKNNHITQSPLLKKMFNVLQYQRSHVIDSDYNNPVTCLTQSYIFLSDIRENVRESKSK